MTRDPTVMSTIDGRCPGRSDGGQHRPRHDAGNTTAHPLPGDFDASQPTFRAAHADASAPTFSSVLCAVDRSLNSHAARSQATLLASHGGTVELVPIPRLTRHGIGALRDACDHHDLLALRHGTAASAAVQHVPIPVLIACWGPPGTKVTDTILVPVDGTPEASRAVALAGRLAAAHGGTVSILEAPAHDPARQRAIAASSRVLLHATGRLPRVLGQPLPLERAISSAAIALSASLVVLGSGSSECARTTTARITGCIRCSVLSVPVVMQIPGV